MYRIWAFPCKMETKIWLSDVWQSYVSDFILSILRRYPYSIFSRMRLSDEKSKCLIMLFTCPLSLSPVEVRSNRVLLHSENPGRWARPQMPSLLQRVESESDPVSSCCAQFWSWEIISGRDHLWAASNWLKMVVSYITFINSINRMLVFNKSRQF